MTKKTTFATALVTLCMSVAQHTLAQYPQIGNSDFELWSGADGKNEPDNWNSFETAGGQWASFTSAQQVAQSHNIRPGSSGTSSAVIWARDVTLAIAQGNLTLGQIQAGATNAEAKNNHNKSLCNDEKFSERIGVLPDSIVAWVRFVPKDDNYQARISAVVHDEYNYIVYGTDKYDKEDAQNAKHAVAKAELNFGPKKDGDEYVWQRISLPFVETGLSFNAQYIIVNFATNSFPGKGAAGDSLYIDDVELIYLPSEEAGNGTYYLQCNGSGKWLNTGLTDNTQAVTSTKALDLYMTKVEGNVFTINSRIGQTPQTYLDSEGKMNGESTNIALVNVEGNTYNICVEDEGVKKYLTENADGSVTFEAGNGSTNAERWTLTSESAMKELLTKATGDAPVDATYLLKGANFNNLDTRLGYWTQTIGQSNQYEIKVGGDKTNSNCEFYNSDPKHTNWIAFIPITNYYNTSFSVKQSANVPNGWYKVSAQGFFRKKSNADNTKNDHAAIMSINGEEKLLPNIFSGATTEQIHEDAASVDDIGYIPNNQASASAYFSAGKYQICDTLIEVKDENLTIEFSKPNEKYESWTCFDNVEIIYYGAEDPHKPTFKIGTTPEQSNIGSEIAVDYKLFAGIGGDISTNNVVYADLIDNSGNRTRVASSAGNTNGQLDIAMPDVPGNYTLAIGCTEGEFGETETPILVTKNYVFEVTFPTEDTFYRGHEACASYYFEDAYPSILASDEQPTVSLILCSATKETVLASTEIVEGAETPIPGLIASDQSTIFTYTLKVAVDNTELSEKSSTTYKVAKVTAAKLSVQFPTAKEFVVGDDTNHAVEFTFTDSKPSAFAQYTVLDVTLSASSESGTIILGNATISAGQTTGSIQFAWPNDIEPGDYTMTVNVANMDLSQSSSVTIKDAETPTKVSAIDANTPYYVIDMAGRTIRKGNGQADLTGLVPGLYIVHQGTDSHTEMVR